MTVSGLQLLLNIYFREFQVPASVTVDGQHGPETREAIRTAKLCMGYAPQYATVVRSPIFYARLRRPLSRALFTDKQRARGLAFRITLRASGGLSEVEAGDSYTDDDGRVYTISATDAPNLLWWHKDRVAIARWIAPQLLAAKKAGWPGEITNGWRSYPHQHWLYYESGFSPVAFPGTSRHEGSRWPLGAIDVPDPTVLVAALAAAWKGPYTLKHAGVVDPPHFSWPSQGSY